MNENGPIFSVLSGKSIGSCTVDLSQGNNDPCAEGSKCCYTSMDGPVYSGNCITGYYGWEYYGYASLEACVSEGAFSFESCSYPACPAGYGYLNEGP